LDVVPAVDQGGEQVEAGIAGEGFGVDCQPGFALSGKDVVIVQVPGLRQGSDMTVVSVWVRTLRIMWV
jgi:hypothetical protein